MTFYKGKSWCESSPGPGEDIPCGNNACPKWLPPEEAIRCVTHKVPVAYAYFRETEFCAGFIPVRLDEIA